MVEAQGFGIVKMNMTFKVTDAKLATMYHVLYIPKLSGNLFLLGAATRKGNTWQFKKSHATYMASSSRNGNNGLYQLYVK